VCVRLMLNDCFFVVRWNWGKKPKSKEREWERFQIFMSAIWWKKIWSRNYHIIIARSARFETASPKLNEKHLHKYKVFFLNDLKKRFVIKNRPERRREAAWSRILSISLQHPSNLFITCCWVILFGERKFRWKTCDRNKRVV
jgi:hypothetical protein